MTCATTFLFQRFMVLDFSCQWIPINPQSAISILPFYRGLNRAADFPPIGNGLYHEVRLLAIAYGVDFGNFPLQAFPQVGVRLEGQSHYYRIGFEGLSFSLLSYDI